MLQTYIGVVHKERDSDFGVSFPDIPGVVTAGKTLNDAVKMAQEALTFHIEGLIEDGDDIPPPSNLEQLRGEQENPADALILVHVLLDTPTARINVSLPEDVLKQIDEHARRHGLTRSGFLTQAARQAMEKTS